MGCVSDRFDLYENNGSLLLVDTREKKVLMKQTSTDASVKTLLGHMVDAANKSFSE